MNKPKPAEFVYTAYWNNPLIALGTFATYADAWQALRHVCLDGAIVAVAGHVSQEPAGKPTITLADYQAQELAKLPKEEVTPHE